MIELYGGPGDGTRVETLPGADDELRAIMVPHTYRCAECKALHTVALQYTRRIDGTFWLDGMGPPA